MKIILTGRAAGKTYRVLEEFLKNDKAILWVFSATEKSRLVSNYCLTPEQSDRIITGDSLEFIKRQMMGRRSPPLLIDNADILLRYLLTPFHIETITMTDGEYIDIEKSTDRPRQLTGKFK